MASMHIVTVHFHIAPDHREDFLREIKANASRSVEHEPGCRQFDVCVSPDDAGHVFLYEVYDNRAAFDAHLASAHFQRFNSLTTDWVVSKQVESFERV